LTQLNYLYLDNNQLSGTIPSFGSLTQLRCINICLINELVPTGVPFK